MRLHTLCALLFLAVEAAAGTRVEWRIPASGVLPGHAGDTVILHSVSYPNSSEVDALRRFPGRLGLVLWNQLPGPHDLDTLGRFPGRVTFVLRQYPNQNELDYLARLPDSQVVVAGHGVPPALDPWSYFDPLGVHWPDRRTTEILARYKIPTILIVRGSFPDHVMMDAVSVLPKHTHIVLNAGLTAGAATVARSRPIEVRTVQTGWLFPAELAQRLSAIAVGPHRRLAGAP